MTELHCMNDDFLDSEYGGGDDDDVNECWCNIIFL